MPPTPDSAAWYSAKVAPSAAFVAAREANAHISAPELYRKAEFYLLKARETYRKKYFDKAKDYALLARKFAETAEFVALKKATLEDL